jgi:class 3 adenylate cyclase
VIWAARRLGPGGVGQVVLSATTRSLVNAREVAVDAAGEVQLAGFAGTVQVFVARGVESGVAKES